MILRIEDIDPTRARAEFTEAIFEDLRWLGLPWDEPVRVQSEHLADYAAALGRLEQAGVVYPCFCSRKDVAAASEADHGSGEPVYPGTCRTIDPAIAREKMESGLPYSLRVDAGKAFTLVGNLSFVEHGESVQVNKGSIGDFVVARKETPTSYHLSVVVDDAQQGVTLVTRGADLLPATGPQRLLQALLGLPEPAYRHHSLVCDENGNRLAKRDGSVSIRALRENGMTPAQVLELAESRLCP